MTFNNNKLMTTRFILFSAILLLVACKETTPQEVVLPTNLSTSIAITDRTVDITATASGANFYTSTFFEGNDSTVVESTDGIANYTFSANGTYLVKTRAHTNYFDYIYTLDSVTAYIDPNQGYSTPMSYPNYTLVWSDEFNGTSLSGDWVNEIGTGNNGWGNNEEQYYLQENTTVENGLLTITAKQQSIGGKSYTSSRIITQGRQSFRYGRIDIRAKLPYGQGIWPALWMLGNDISSVGWPNCGEIDIMEMVGGTGSPNRTVHGTIHWDNGGTYANYGGSNSISSGKFADEFHVFSIIWNQSSIRYLRDDVEYHVVDITPANLSEFHQNFFFIFNVAVGGNWPGSPNASTVFPQTMQIDYVRVFQ
jgi:hypothetical protein